MNVLPQESNFDEIKLGEALVFQRGFDITKSEQNEGEVPIVSSSGVSSFHNQWKVAGPGVIIGRKGTLGTVHFLKGNYWPHDTTLWVKDFKGNDVHLIYYFLQTLHLENFDTGSSNPTLNRNHIHKIKVLFPKRQVQRKIAASLSAYDDLIENNRRRIALLEKMAEEIYREWFVRMRFPEHEQAKFEKGVPEGWRICNVQSLGKVITGKTPSTENSRYYGGRFPFIKTPDMHGNYFIFETDETLTEEGVNSQPSQTIPKNSILISCIGTGGIVAITTTTSQTNQQINSVILNNIFDLPWAFHLLRSLKETIELYGSTGTTMTNLSKGKLCDIKILVPPDTLRRQFNALVSLMFSQVKRLMQSNIELRQTRDLLLPRLISGKLDVENLDIQLPPSMLNEPSPQPSPGRRGRAMAE